MKKRQLHPVHGIIAFIAVILMMIFVAAPIQIRFGMAGLAVTEVLILLIGLIPCLLLKQPLAEIFPIRFPKFRELAGTVLIWLGCFLLGTAGSLIVTYFFPEEMSDVSGSMLSTFTSIPFFISFFIVAIMPAICEEALHRGFILSSMRTIKNDFLIVLIMGILFGLFHLSLYRFLTTAILGMGLSYLMVKTKNILLPMLFHFINNSLSICTSFFITGNSKAETTSQSLTILPMATLGLYLLLCALVPALLFLGSILIKGWKETKKAGQKKLIITFVTAVILSVIFAITGMVIMINGTLNRTPLINTSWTKEITQQTETSEETIIIEKSELYTASLSVHCDNPDIITTTILKKNDGSEIFHMSGSSFTFYQSYLLENGEYTLICEYTAKNENALRDNNEVVMKINMY